MGWKDWLDKAREGLGGGSAEPEELSAEDLVTLGRYSEAVEKLRARLKRRKDDLRTRQRLADMLAKTGERVEALKEYLTVADSYARDGFYDKARAVLGTVARRFPGQPEIESRLERLERSRRLDELRRTLVEAVPMSSAMRIEQLWKHIVSGELVDRLSERQLARLLPALEMRELDEGTKLVAAGERRDELWWVVEGRIAARAALRSGAETDLRGFEAGALIGERALLERQPWPAAYVAATKSAVLVLGREALAKLLTGEDDPRGLLDALRAEHNDEAVAVLVERMGKEE